MSDSADLARRRRDLERFLTFVDAVVAIAITLLVLPLVELTGEVGDADGSVSDLLHDHQAELWSFLLSFAVIARLWFAQHRAVRSLVLAHRGVTSLLVLWTLTIVFLPFPTALVAKAGEQPPTKLLYMGTILLSTVLVGLIDQVIASNPEISDGAGPPDAERAIISAALLGLALVVTLAIPDTSYFPLLLLLLETPVRRLLHRGRGSKTGAAHMGE